MSMLAIVLTLLLLMYFAYRGYTVLLLAPVLAALAVILSGETALMLPKYTETFMSALGKYMIQFFPVFLLGALFGQLMADSGAASAIANWIRDKLGAKHAMLTVVLACAVLTYGGVSLFVVAFAIYPIARELFHAADIPKRLIPPAIALGSFTFTMTALPGTPAIQNAIPIPYYGTNTFAAPGLGIVGALIIFGLGMAWLNSRARAARARNEGYGQHAEDLEEFARAKAAAGRTRDVGTTGPNAAGASAFVRTADVSAADVRENEMDEVARARADARSAEAAHAARPMSVGVAMLPLVLVVALNAVFTYGVFPGMDFSFLKSPFPSLDPAKMTGLWALIVALAVSCAVLMVMRIGRWASLRETINKGVYGSMLPIFNTASEVGYGAVIAGLAGFALIRDAVLNVSPSNPLISEAVAMNVLAGITGSSSGGLSIALQTLGADYLRMANEAGISPEVLHRVAVMAAGCFDTLPHCGAIITLLAICKLTHRESYLNIGMLTLVIPLVALVCVIAIGTNFGAF